MIAAAVVAVTSGCSLKTTMVKTQAPDSRPESVRVFASESDPDVVREAVPFALKLYESLLASVPGRGFGAVAEPYGDRAAGAAG